MDRQIRRHLDRRGIRLAHGRPADGLLGTDGGMAAFLHWFHEDVMMFDSMGYRRQFWREAYRHGHTIGHMPHTAVEFTDPRRHPYNEWLANLLFLTLAMGASAVVWLLVRAVDAHVRHLRRPTYYEAERERRLALAEERRRIRKRRTTNPCPTPEMLRASFAQARASVANMIRFGSMLEDLECYVDNSVVWSATDGRIVGRKGGIRQWLRENAPDLYERYKTVMKYKALAKRFRQAVGASDPVPAATVLPPDLPQKAKSDNEKDRREYCKERIRKQQKEDAAGHERERLHRDRSTTHGRMYQEVALERMREIARMLLERCEGTIASLTAQLALMVSADFVPCENIERTKNDRIAERVHRSA